MAPYTLNGPLPSVARNAGATPTPLQPVAGNAQPGYVLLPLVHFRPGYGAWVQGSGLKVQSQGQAAGIRVLSASVGVGVFVQKLNFAGL